MAKKTVNTNQSVNPITINTLNINNESDLTYEIGLAKLIKFVVDKTISEDELNAVFAEVSKLAVEKANDYDDYVIGKMLECYDDCGNMCDSCGNRCECEDSEHRDGFMKRTWNKVKGWFKK